MRAHLLVTAFFALAFAGTATPQETAKQAPSATAQTGAVPQAGAAPKAPVARQPKRAGYLDPEQPVDGTRFLPPFPSPGSPAEAADIAAYREALNQENTARWKQAADDDSVDLKNGLTQFQCALGATLTEENAPTLMTVLGKSQFDAHWAIEKSKAHFKRPRPWGENLNAPLCLAVPPAARSKASTAYPGGHSTLGMTWGLILAELAPSRAPEIMSRVRDYSHSRLVCGLHYPADLEAGHMLGAAVVARLHAEPAFRSEMDKARAEVATALAGARPPSGCSTSAAG